MYYAYIQILCGYALVALRRSLRFMWSRWQCTPPHPHTDTPTHPTHTHCISLAPSVSFYFPLLQCSLPAQLGVLLTVIASNTCQRGLGRPHDRHTRPYTTRAVLHQKTRRKPGVLEVVLPLVTGVPRPPIQRTLIPRQVGLTFVCCACTNNLKKTPKKIVL